MGITPPNDFYLQNTHLVERTDTAISKLKRQPIDSSIGYNDVAILFALAQGETYGFIFNPENYLSSYLCQDSRNSDLPKDSMLSPDQVELYLQKILEVRLIRKTENGYQMEEDVMAMITIKINSYRTKGLERWVLLGIIPYTIRRFHSVERRDFFDRRATHLQEPKIH